MVTRVIDTKQKVAALRFTKTEPLYRQIAAALRELIGRGEIPPGAKLPPSQELESLWQASAQTVHSALSLLDKEGLVSRAPRTGTFVRQREQKLTCVGIYYREDFWANPETAFTRSVHAALKEEFNRRGIETRVWVDHRPAAEHARPWAELERAAERREIQGLIVTAIDWPHYQWLNKLPVPAAYLADNNIASEVRHDLEQLADSSLQALAKQGCRSVGLICPMPAVLTNPDGSRHVAGRFYERFTDLASDLGLAVRNEWMRVLSKEDPTGQVSQEKFGYEEFLRLWDQPERPEGLFVFPDTSARGVILGLRENQVRVPAELKLVLSKNEAIDLLCPMPATFAVSSEREAARALIKQIEKQFRGERCEPISLRFRLVAHDGRRR